MTGRSVPAGASPRTGLARRAGALPRAGAPTARVARTVALVARLATWLLLAVAVDLVVSRVVVRLAIFIPKGEPWTTVSSWLGQVGAVTDALVPIVAILLLGGLLLSAGEGSRTDRALTVGGAIVAAAGIAFVAVAPTPAAALVADGVIVLVAIGAVVTWRPSPSVPRPAWVGVATLAFALAAAALGRMTGATAAMVGAGIAGGPAVVSWIALVGQWAFVGGALLLGFSGLRDWLPGSSRRPILLRLATGLTFALLIVAAASRAPEHMGQLIIWSSGLTGAVPTVVVAAAAALAIVGIPALRRPAPYVALGGSIVLLAGYGLAASGLVLAGLIGLLVARCDATTTMTRRSA